MRMEISAMEEAPRPDLLERKGSLYLRSNHTMQYDRPTLVSGWHQSREAEPKDYDVTALPLGKKNMSRSTYTRIGNVENDIWDTSTEDHLSQIHLQKDYEVKDVPKLMINEGNIDTVNIKRACYPLRFAITGEKHHTGLGPKPRACFPLRFTIPETLNLRILL
ncbi:hypothetical protein FKM82_000595 [Ascaphus truei]